jgi:hypothetical protein
VLVTFVFLGIAYYRTFFFEEEICRPVGEENALRDDCLEPGVSGIHPFVPMRGEQDG